MSMENQLQQKDIEVMQKSISDLAKIVNEGFSEIRTELKIMRDNYVSMDYFKDILAYKEKEIDALKQDIVDIKSNQTWVARTILGIVITAIISAIVISK